MALGETYIDATTEFIHSTEVSWVGYDLIGIVSSTHIGNEHCVCTRK